MESDTSNGNANETDKQNSSDDRQLVEMHRIANTPFTAVKANDEWFLIMGKYRLSEKLESKEACEEMVKDTSWDMLMRIMHIIVEDYHQQKEAINKMTANLTPKEQLNLQIPGGKSPIKETIN